ncbi:MAG: hypothetical protein AB7I19_19910 [Planctomycetota bacterium]
MRRLAWGLLALLAACASAATDRASVRMRIVDADRLLRGESPPPQSDENIILRVEDRDALATIERAADVVRRAGAGLGYWIEVARSPSLAARYPEHVATLQAHDAWRQDQPGAPVAQPGQVLTVSPYVPVTTTEGAALQLARVNGLLERLPRADELWLAGLQTAPSACGCGHPWCRWATDYFLRDDAHPTKIPSGTAIGLDAAARFCASIEAAGHGARVVPVFVPECLDEDESCHGVPCFDGACWPALALQWTPVAQRYRKLGVHLPTRSVGRPITASAARTALAMMSRYERKDVATIDVDPERITVIVEEPIDGLETAVLSEAEFEASWQVVVR